MAWYLINFTVKGISRYNSAYLEPVS
jgi:hypothetical protein